MAAKAIDACAVIGHDEMYMMALGVSSAKNQQCRRAGYSPYMWTFGKEMNLPDSILADGLLWPPRTFPTTRSSSAA